MQNRFQSGERDPKYHFNTGCSDVAANTEMSQRILTGFAANPNVYGVVIIGLGCETVGHAVLCEK